MEEQIKKIASRVFRVEESTLTKDSSPETISRWDSLRHIEFISAIEAQFEFQLTADEIVSINSLGDVVRLTLQKSSS